MKNLHIVHDLSELKPGDTVRHKAHGDEWLVLEVRPGFDALDPLTAVIGKATIIYNSNEWLVYRDENKPENKEREKSPTPPGDNHATV